MLAQQLEGVDLSPSEAREARVKLQATGKAKLASLLQVWLAYWWYERVGCVDSCQGASRSPAIFGTLQKLVSTCTLPWSTLQEAALTRVSRMRDAFNASFTLDENKTPR